jgi:hypothetical protein
MSETTSVNFKAYKLSYYPPCETEEVIGYFMEYKRAEFEKMNYINRKGLKGDGICCSNLKWVEITEIIIQQ